MRQFLTSPAYRRLAALLLAAGMPWGLGVPGQLMFLVSWLAEGHAVTGLGALIRAGVRAQAKQAKDKPIVALMNALAVWMVFTSAFALSKGTAFGSSVMTALVAWVCFTIIVPHLLSDKPMQTALLATFVSSTTILSAVAAIRTTQHPGSYWPRADVWIVGSNLLGNVAATSLLASVLLFARVKPRWRVVVCLAAVIQLTTLVLTLSRGSWLAMMAGVLVLMLCTRSKAVIAMALAIVVVFTAAAATNPALLRRIESIVSLERNSDRITLFTAGIRMMLDRPLTGYGVNNVGDAYNLYREKPSGDRAPFLHNIFIEFGATTGVPGLILVAALIGGLLLMGAKLTLLRRAPLYMCVFFSILVAQIVHLQVDIIIFAASAMPLVFIPIGIVLRYHESLKTSR